MFTNFTTVVNATSKEEAIHAQFGAELIKIIKHENPEWFDQEMEDKIRRNIRKALTAEEGETPSKKATKKKTAPVKVAPSLGTPTDKPSLKKPGAGSNKNFSEKVSSIGEDAVDDELLARFG